MPGFKRKEEMVNDIRVITALHKKDCEHLLGEFLDDSHYDILINEDCDFYVPNLSLFNIPNSEANIGFKFRKGVFSPSEQKLAYEGLIGAVRESHNRGIASGPKGAKNKLQDWVSEIQLDILDALINPKLQFDGSLVLDQIVQTYHSGTFDDSSPRGLLWLRKKFKFIGYNKETFFDDWLTDTLLLDNNGRKREAKTLMDHFISRTIYANTVYSGIAGFYDRYPRTPYGRPTSYTEKFRDTFELSFPFLHNLNDKFKYLLPQRWNFQRNAADQIDSKFVISDTVFTTITVNKNFQTAAHLDADDLEDGFSNLNVVTNGKDFKGGYLVLPEYGIAVDIRPGDLLLIANHTAIHGNTKIEGGCDSERLSIVSYFRENMLKLGEYDYEQLRREFIEYRRMDNTHIEWHSLWNGISCGMFADKVTDDPEKAKEWYNWLIKKENGYQYLEMYHPWLIEHFESEQVNIHNWM